VVVILSITDQPIFHFLSQQNCTRSILFWYFG